MPSTIPYVVWENGPFRAQTSVEWEDNEPLTGVYLSEILVQLDKVVVCDTRFSCNGSFVRIPFSMFKAWAASGWRLDVIARDGSRHSSRGTKKDDVVLRQGS